jgi:hypothetical protein
MILQPDNNTHDGSSPGCFLWLSPKGIFAHRRALRNSSVKPALTAQKPPEYDGFVKPAYPATSGGPNFSTDLCNLTVRQ